MEKYRIAVVGANSLAGRELVQILESRNFPLADLKLWAVGAEEGKTIPGRQHAFNIQSLEHTSEQEVFLGKDIVFFTGDDNLSRHWVPAARRAGATVIDGSSVFRLEAEVPLVVPEINAADIQDHKGIIASPACGATILNMVVYPLHKVNPMNRIVVSTYQSTSGMGQAAMDELTEQTRRAMEGGSSRPNIFPHEIGFNVLPQVDVFLDNGYTKEERQLLEETRKILHNSDILVSATCARVPIYKGHSQAVTMDFGQEINPDIARDILSRTPGVRVVDDPEINLYPHPRMAAATDLVMVGRIRQDMFNLSGLALWVVADNIRKGAALNMVQIAEEINRKGWLKAKGQR